MSITTITFNAEYGTDTSPIRLFDITVTGDSSYPTDGTATITTVLRDLIAAARPRAGSLGNLALLSISNTHAQGTYEYIFDKVNDKLLVRALADGTQPNNGTNLAGATYRLMTTWG